MIMYFRYEFLRMFPVMFRKKESLRKCCIEYISDNVINYTPNNIDHILLSSYLHSL